MLVDTMIYESGTLSVRCSGTFGIGSLGNPSGDLLRESIRHWMTDHPAAVVTRIQVDLTIVEYIWGGGPVSSMMPLFRSGIREVQVLAGPQNADALEELIQACRIPGFIIKRLDA